MIMKKIVLAVLALLVGSVNLFAGDVATFVDCGFSANGKYYVFGPFPKPRISSGIFFPPKSKRTTNAMIIISPVPKLPINNK